MRLCPTVEGSGSPLITHRIGVDVCAARQDTNFHKCHRCIYRGQALTWEPATSANAMVDVSAEETRDLEVKAIEISRPAKKPAKVAAPIASSKPAVKKAAQAAS